MFNILVAEDDADLRKIMCGFLEHNGFRAYGAENGDLALSLMDQVQIDLIIADILMPKTDGVALTRELREAGYTLPILMVTALGDFSDKETAFNAGADDYMVKPIDMQEMLLRIGALLRRAKIANEHCLTVGETVLDYDALSVSRSGAVQQLPQKEFYLLFKLLSYQGKIFTRTQLMDDIWGMDSETDERTVDVHINRLRERFRSNPDFTLITVRGLGYKAVKNVE